MSEKLKILHIVAGAPTGGAETFSQDAMCALHERGVEQRVLCRPHPNRVNAMEERDIPYTPLTFNRFKKRGEQKIIRAAIEEFKPDLVHCWMSRASSFMPAGTGVPVLGWFGGYYDLKNYKNCDFYMGVTRDIVRHIRENISDPSRAFVGHTFGTLPEDKPVTRTEFNIPDDAKVVLLLSRMHWKKGVDPLLEAADATTPNIYYLLAGDGPEQEKYETMCSKMGLDDRVRFLGWRNDRAALLDIADICVLPSRYEPFGTVIAESWFAGVPLIAAKAAGAKQYVTHEQDGLLHEIDDAQTLAAQIQDIANDDALAEKLVSGGKQTYEELFSKQVVIDTLLTHYKEMIARAANSLKTAAR